MGVGCPGVVLIPQAGGDGGAEESLRHSLVGDSESNLHTVTVSKKLTERGLPASSVVGAKRRLLCTLVRMGRKELLREGKSCRLVLLLLLTEPGRCWR